MMVSGQGAPASLAEWRSRFEALAPGGEPVRAEAFARFSALGLPDRRQEYWKYTRLGNFHPDNTTRKADGGDGGKSAVLPDHYRLTFTDGRIDPDRSDLGVLGDKAEILPLSRPDHPAWLAKLNGGLQRDDKRIPRPLADLNLALHSDGLALSIPARVRIDKPLCVCYRGVRRAHLRLVLRLGEGAALSLIETGDALATCVCEVDIDRSALLHHLRLQTDGADAQFCMLFARLESDSSYESLTLSADMALARNESVLTLAGARAKAHFGGAVMACGEAHIDNTLFIEHAAPDCPSRQTFVAALADRARSVFQGKIRVAQGAPRTDGYQIAKGALLGSEARFDVKPELEIYEDDVKCSHGATIGALDPESLFYLRTRGIAPARARAILTRAFLEDALLEMTDPALYECAAMLVDARTGVTGRSGAA